MTAPAYVGIDVSKGHLNASALPSAESWRTANAPDALASRLINLWAALIVIGFLFSLLGRGRCRNQSHAVTFKQE